MDWIEVTGRTVDEAKELALDTLGVHETELEYEVLEEPRGGFLGIGRAEARIRARVRPMSREKPQDKRRRKRTEQRRGGAGGSRPKTGQSSPPQPAGENTALAASGGSSGAKGPGRESTGTGRRRSRRRPDGASDAAPQIDQTPAPTRDRGGANDGGPQMADVTISVDEQMAEAKDFAEGLLDAFGVEARIDAHLEDDDIAIDIEGDNLGVLVGPKGATLAAVEELVRTAVLVRAGGFGARIHVDVGGYRRRRREALSNFAAKLAEDVRASGVAKALEPMSAADRKVVHDTVSEIDGVATSSEGEDQRRHVVIRPT